VRDRGHAAVELAMAIGVLLLPVALVVTAFGPWSERRVAASAVAAEAARAVVIELRHEAGTAVVSASADALGLDESLFRVGWCDATPGPVTAPSGQCPLSRGSVVAVTVQIWTPLIDTPWGQVGGLWVTASHSEPIDLYRSLG
jgi:Flp pilus assembly protein TadG